MLTLTRRRATPAVLAACAALAACRADDHASAAALPPKPLEVQLTPIVPCTVPESLVLTGSLMASRQARVSPNGAGKVVRVAVERGQRVRQGDLLVVLDSRVSERSVEAATAQAQLAEAQRALAEKECARARALFEAGALPRAELDRVSAQCTVQAQAVRVAQASKGIASQAADDAAVRAPFDGVVGDRLVEVGEFVQPFVPLLQLFSTGSLRLEFAVPEESAASAQPGKKVSFRAGALDGESMTATVSRVSPNVRPLTRDLLVEATVERPDERLRPGMFAVVDLVVGEHEGICVEREALRWEGTSPHLFLAAGGRVLEQVVRTGAPHGRLVPLIEPLRADARAVINPSATLRDGMAIEE